MFGSFIAGLPFENDETISEWMNWVLEHPELIHGTHIMPLSINPGAVSSEIEKNPEKYGYVLSKDQATGKINWVNNVGYTLGQAAKLSDQWVNKLWNENRITVAGWDMMGLQTTGLTFDDLYGVPLNKLPFDFIQAQTKQKYLRYKTNLMDYLK